MCVVVGYITIYFMEFKANDFWTQSANMRLDSREAEFMIYGVDDD